MPTETLRRAAEIWNYFASFRGVAVSDAIVVCCSYDLRVCDHACDLVAAGVADTLLLSGRHGSWTRHLWSDPEAEVFRERALANGVPENRILLETEATNFGENIAYAKLLLPAARIVTFVTKPNSLLRAKLTAAAQWPEVVAHVSCPDLEFPDEVSEVIGIWGVINEMVGDVERIMRYPDAGYQAEHELPPAIVDDWRFLREAGFTHHSMSDRSPAAGPDARCRRSNRPEAGGRAGRRTT